MSNDNKLMTFHLYSASVALKVRKDKCLLEGKKMYYYNFTVLTLSDDAESYLALVENG